MIRLQFLYLPVAFIAPGTKAARSGHNYPMIHFNRVHKYHQTQPLLYDFSLFLAKGSYTCIDTDSTTATAIQRMIMAYEKPDNGDLTVDGISIADIPNARIPYLRRQIGLIESKPLLLENRSIRDNIEMPLRILELSTKAITDRVNETLNQSGLTEVADKPAKHLDEPTRRLVACARATVHRPCIVLADAAQSHQPASIRAVESRILESAWHQNSCIIRFGTPRELEGRPADCSIMTVGQSKRQKYEPSAEFNTDR